MTDKTTKDSKRIAEETGSNFEAVVDPHQPGFCRFHPSIATYTKCTICEKELCVQCSRALTVGHG